MNILSLNNRPIVLNNKLFDLSQLSLSVSTLSFNADGTAKTSNTFTVTSNKPWTLNVFIGDTWITPNISSGPAGITNVTLTIDENEEWIEQEKRLGGIRFLIGSKIFTSLGVEQDTPEAEMLFNPDTSATLYFDYQGNPTYYLQIGITPNGAWYSTSDYGYVSTTPSNSLSSGFQNVDLSSLGNPSAFPIYDTLHFYMGSNLMGSFSCVIDYDDEPVDPCYPFITCLPGDTLITMVDSIKEISDIKNGDILLSYDVNNNTFMPTEIINIGMAKHNKMVKIIFTDYSELHCTPDHPWYAENIGWVSCDVNWTLRHYNNITVNKLEIGHILKGETSKEVKDLVFYVEEMDTYQIIELSNGDTYFANGMLTRIEN